MIEIPLGYKIISVENWRMEGENQSFYNLGTFKWLFCLFFTSYHIPIALDKVNSMQIYDASGKKNIF